MEHRLAGQMIDAKALGRNEYDDLESCAFIYSSKATPNDESLKALTGITDAQIERAREEEDVLQFVMRGAVRKRDFGGLYNVYLYTKKQADDLATKLNASQVGKVTVLPVSGAGILTATGKATKAGNSTSAKTSTARLKSTRSNKDILASSEARALRREKSNKPKNPVGRPRKNAPKR